MEHEPLSRIRAVFGGRVQGVGFRYTVRSISVEFDVSGFVRNLPDGTVELEAQGPDSQVKEFIESIKSAMSQHISRTDVASLLPLGDDRGFEIRR